VNIRLSASSQRQTEHFVYLHGIVSTDQSNDKDIERRKIWLAAWHSEKVMRSMRRRVYKQRNPGDIIQDVSLVSSVI